MQWDKGANLGFSDGNASDLYLPVDASSDAPTVEAQEEDPDSLLNTVRAILALRRREEDLQADAGLEIICSEPGRPLVYRRGSLLCVVNPEGRELEMALPAEIADKLQGEVLFGIGNVTAEGGLVRAGAQSFVVIR